jgi:glyoxylase-like metal-dependent hydrolase (beta-lactamase superfamily II)
VALRLGSGAVLTGDHVLGRGTSVVAHPDGDLEAYLASLRRVLDLGPAALHPGHGPSLTEDPAAVLDLLPRPPPVP